MRPRRDRSVAPSILTAAFAWPPGGSLGGQASRPRSVFSGPGAHRQQAHPNSRHHVCKSPAAPESQTALPAGVWRGHPATLTEPMTWSGREARLAAVTAVQDPPPCRATARHSSAPKSAVV